MQRQFVLMLTNLATTGGGAAKYLDVVGAALAKRSERSAAYAQHRAPAQSGACYNHPVMRPPERQMDEADRKRIGQAVKEHIAREGLSREEFAFRTKIPKATIDKLVIGIFSEKTLARLERAVGRAFQRAGSSLARAADSLGGYLHADYRHLEGRYLMVRPAFDGEQSICLFPMEIKWDDSSPGLCLTGKPEEGIEKSGQISIPKNSQYLFVNSNELGWQSVLIMSLVNDDEIMRGGLFTLGNVGGNNYVPVFAPVILQGGQRSANERPALLAPSDARYASLAGLLASVCKDKFVRVIGCAQ